VRFRAGDDLGVDPRARSKRVALRGRARGGPPRGHEPDDAQRACSPRTLGRIDERAWAIDRGAGSSGVTPAYTTARSPNAATASQGVASPLNKVA